MKRIGLIGLIVMLALGALANGLLAGFLPSEGVPLSTSLNGAEEVGNPGDPDASGFAKIAINTITDTVCVEISVINVGTPITLSHIHQGAFGANGPVVVDFASILEADGGFEGCVVDTDADAIVADAESFYVNVHNGEFPSGAVRGQLSLVAVYSPLVNGAQEVGGGDPDGSGVAQLAFDIESDTDTDADELCYEIAVTGIALPVTLAHIHQGEPGVNGSVVIDFLPGGEDADGLFSGCLTDAEVNTIAADPSGFYVNIHNAEFPGGALRGQIKLVETFTVPVEGEQEVPTDGDLDGSGSAVLEFDADANEVCFNIAVIDIALPVTLAHIHQSDFGTNGPVVIDFLPSGEDADGTFSGCIIDTDVDAVVENPAGFYVNIHNAEFPGGALRGQVKLAATLSVTVEGEQEVPTAGDLDGSGSAVLVLDTDTDEVCFDVLVFDIAVPVTLAHIHQGEFGVNGPVVIDFLPGGEDADGVFSGCVIDTDVDAIFANPAGFYVNIHNGEFPSGALRGQLVLPTVPTPTPSATSTPAVTATATASGPTATATEVVFDDGALVDGGFEDPDGIVWVVKNGTGDKIKCNKPGKELAYEGLCYFRFKGGVAEASKVVQEVDFTTRAPGDVLTLSGFYRPQASLSLKASLKVKYTDTTKDKKTFDIAPGSAQVYSPFQVEPLTLASAGTVKVQFSYKGASGKIYLDNIALSVTSGGSLVPLPAAQMQHNH
ncbi:MAG: CHRD domain-containing protein [Armatimonadetes bacterium]|nr:CHRD domain-containing protein [Anaerolineae bacterium]